MDQDTNNAKQTETDGSNSKTASSVKEKTTSPLTAGKRDLLLSKLAQACELLSGVTGVLEGIPEEDVEGNTSHFEDPTQMTDPSAAASESEAKKEGEEEAMEEDDEEKEGIEEEDEGEETFSSYQHLALKMLGMATLEAWTTEAHRERIVSTMRALGEVSIANENYKQAVEKIQECLKKLGQFPKDAK